MANRSAIFAATWVMVTIGSESARAQQSTDGDVTLRARAVLRKYCAECHHPDAGHRGELSVVEHAGLTARPDRPFLIPNRASASQIVQLIEDGSMPPGRRAKPTADELKWVREWIDAAAPVFPRTFDESYVLTSILADVKQLPPQDRSHVRYVSLHGVIPPADPSFSLTAKRELLNRSVAGFASKGAPAAVPVDGIGAVVRIDLKKLGWDAKPYSIVKTAEGRKETVTSEVNLYDVILMEYPLGSIPLESAAFRELSEQFLRPVRQAIPVSYLRGEWLVDEFAKSTVAAEIRNFLGLPSASPTAPIGPSLSPDRPSGIPILPLNSVALAPSHSPPGGFFVTFETQDVKTKLARTEFKHSDRMAIFVRTSRRSWIQIHQTDMSGKCNIVPLGNRDFFDKDDSERFVGPDGTGFEFDEGPDGEESLTIFACESPLPPAEVLKTSKMNDRVLHRFYSLPGEQPKSEFDPANVFKKTVNYKLRKK